MVEDSTITSPFIVTDSLYRGEMLEDVRYIHFKNLYSNLAIDIYDNILGGDGLDHIIDPVKKALVKCYSDRSREERIRINSLFGELGNKYKSFNRGTELQRGITECGRLLLQDLVDKNLENNPTFVFISGQVDIVFYRGDMIGVDIYGLPYVSGECPFYINHGMSRMVYVTEKGLRTSGMSFGTYWKNELEKNKSEIKQRLRSKRLNEILDL